ncbi:MAG: hypothetical protein HY318_16550 [Armatimonadetes bacterium]|nr:hypothetical protein [Armatimonadota bacterium]
MATQLAVYTDTLLFPVILKRINEAQGSIKILTFVFKASYDSPNRGSAESTGNPLASVPIDRVSCPMLNFVRHASWNGICPVFCLGALQDQDLRDHPA